MSQVLTQSKGLALSITGAVFHNDTRQDIPIEAARVFARAGGMAVITIQNNDAVAYDVSVPLREFVPRDGGPAGPIEEPAAGGDTVRVFPRDIEVLRYKVKPASHFHFSQAKPTFTYKFTMHYQEVGKSAWTDVDPDLEVSA
jgi:hypothetical protein